MDESANPSVEALLAHAGWVRAMARTLVLDPNDADDLAQETMATALSSRPYPGSGFAGWLATTLRNVKRQRRRRESVRERFESLGARAERQPSTADLAEQADLQRALVAHVLALEEPYRGVLLQRWFAELEPAEIAARARVPLATVTSQLTRAHQKLRERLERSHGGGGSAWLSALVPLIRRPETLTTAGGALLNAKIALSAAAVVLVAGVLVWMRSATPSVSEPATQTRETAALAERAGNEKEGALEIGSAAQQERESLARVAKAPAVPASGAQTALKHVRGRVLDSDGHPLAGLGVGWSGTLGQGLSEGHVKSGAQGWFELETTASKGEIDVFEPAWTTVRCGAWRESSKVDPVVIIARAIALGGSVQDEHGQPLAGARVHLVQPGGFGTRFEGNLEATITQGWRTITDANGRFSFPRVPAIAGATLRGVLEGYDVTEVSEPPARDEAITIVLQRPKVPLAGALHGRVVDDHGTPVPMARVFLGLASTMTDDKGAFALSLSRAVSSDHISAIKSGYRPAVLDRPRAPHGDETGWPDSIELQLPGPTLSIRGIVVDRAGHPRPKMRVSLADPTPVGAIGKMPTFAENLMAGARVPPFALESEARQPKTDGDSFNDFYLHNLEPSAFWHWVPTDENGRFELTGLDDRRYRLRLMDPVSLEITTTEEYQAGGDTVRITTPDPDLLERVAGRVVDDDGKPIAGVSVHIDGEAVGVRSRVFGGRVYVSLRDPREIVLTDAAGKFELHNVPRTSIQLMVESEDTIPAELELAKQPDAAAIVIKLHTRCSFQVQITSRDLDVDAVAVLDAQDVQLDILVLESGSVNAFTDTPIVDGRTAVVSASSAAATLLLLKGDEVVKRTTIRLRPDSINRIEM